MVGTPALPARASALRSAHSTASRMLRLSLLGAVVAPALLATTAAAASATKGPYPPAFNCPTSGATVSGASCGVAGTTVTNPHVANQHSAPSVPAAVPSQSSHGGLALTGSDVATPPIVAGGLIAGGVLVSVGARRRRAH
ncbi:MAG: hypothetical protein ABJA87_07710 [bacterium]